MLLKRLFNPDGNTFTFFGFNVDVQTGNLIEPNTGKVLFEGKLALSQNLIRGLNNQNSKVLREIIDKLSKKEKIYKLLSLMGVEWVSDITPDQVQDPDPSYELTMDNLLKIAAIYMRLRANIPVIIMGETGCGKTRLCKYMSDLQKNPSDASSTVNNMYVVKVHGGTTSEDIINHVIKAQALAKKNADKQIGMFTVLFFDEANSTEAIGTIKEIMVCLPSKGCLYTACIFVFVLEKRTISPSF